MRAVFRTDASRSIGTGHVMRCLTLAGVLRDRGDEAVFICRNLEGNLIAHIRDAAGFPVRVIGAGAPTGGAASIDGAAPEADADADLPAHHRWLEAGWREDAEESRAAIESLGARPDWLVVDHYALDRRWQERVAPLAGRLLVIDDIADRGHACDLLLDQNLYDAPEARYAGRVPADARLLLGPAFALLRPEFAAARARARTRQGPPARALVFFGGADPVNATVRAVEALSRPEFAALEADVVAGAVNPNLEAVRAACAARPRTTFHRQAGNMAELMARADLALGAGGTTTWERCCLGLPTLTSWVAENQRELTETLDRHGALHNLGRGDRLTADGIASALSRCLADPGRLEGMSRLGLSLVDGLGAGRVADRLRRGPPPASASPADRTTLRKAGASDMLTYFRWTNDPEVRRQSFRQDPVALADHERWFRERLADPASLLFLLERDGEPAGQIRFQAGGGEAWIGFSVDSRFRGMGLGALLLSRGAREALREPGWEGLQVKGAVKLSNPASRKAFEAAGYREEGTSEVRGEASIVYLYPRVQP